MKKGITLCGGVYAVGAVDFNARNFHGYTTDYGATYNSYVITDEKTALIDCVKAPFVNDLIKNITEITDPAKIDYVVVNHVEPDHSGAFPAIMELCPNAVVIATRQGITTLKNYYGDKNYNFKTVKQGDSVSLGKNTLSFVPVPMLHWPDSMMTYAAEEKILFSNDAFGQHYASNMKFDDELAEAGEINEVFKQVAKYYANIVLPYGSQAAGALTAAAGLDIKIIATSHGVIWRKYIADIIKKYGIWSKNETRNEAVIVYDTMWKSTEHIANAILDGFTKASIPVKLVDIKTRHASDIMLDILEARYICIGSPTLNYNVMPTIASFLTYMKGLAPKNRFGVAFGSYGWSGESVKQIEEAFDAMGAELIVPPIKSLYKPTAEALAGVTESIYNAANAKSAKNSESITPTKKAGKNALEKISSGVFVLTARDNGKDNGCITDTFLQANNASPAECVFAANKRNLTHDMIMNTKKCNISVLTTKAGLEIYKRFGFQSGRNVDKFKDFKDCERSANGLLYVTNYTNAYFSLDVTGSVDFGSHTLFRAVISESRILGGGESVTYGYYQDNIKPAPAAEQKKGYKCNICGYVYEGEPLPPDFICPVCKHGAKDFTKIE